MHQKQPKNVYTGMEKELLEAFKRSTCQPEPTLNQEIWQTLVTRETRLTKIKLVCFSSLGICSIIAIVPVSRILVEDLTRSGFYEYTSLLVSDGGSVVKYWKEFSLSVFESLPSISILLSLTLLFILFLSIKHTAKQIIRNKLAF